MMVWVQIGNSTNVGIFVLRLLFFFDIFVVGDVVNPGFVLFAVRVDHRGSVATTRITFTLHVAFLLAVTADNVWGTGAVVASGVGARGRASWGRVGVFARQLLTTNKRNLFDFFVSQCKFLRPFAVILNGLNFSGGFHTFDSVDENPGKYSIFFALSVEVAGWLLTSDNSNLFDFVVGQFVPENGGGLSPVDENPWKYGIFFASSVEVAGWLLTSDNSNLFDFVVGPFVPENGGGHTGLGSSGGLHHGSGGESLGFLFVECGCDGVKITTLVILTKVENAKVLTKTFYKTFLLSFFLFSVLTKTFHPNRCHH
jgi:hypothetical protein